MEEEISNPEEHNPRGRTHIRHSKKHRARAEQPLSPVTHKPSRHISPSRPKGRDAYEIPKEFTHSVKVPIDRSCTSRTSSPSIRYRYVEVQQKEAERSEQEGNSHYEKQKASQANRGSASHQRSFVRQSMGRPSASRETSFESVTASSIRSHESGQRRRRERRAEQSPAPWKDSIYVHPPPQGDAKVVVTETFEYQPKEGGRSRQRSRDWEDSVSVRETYEYEPAKQEATGEERRRVKERHAYEAKYEEVSSVASPSQCEYQPQREVYPEQEYSQQEYLDQQNFDARNRGNSHFSPESAAQYYNFNWSQGGYEPEPSTVSGRIRNQGQCYEFERPVRIVFDSSESDSPYDGRGEF